ncbi:hypothetical protein R69749_02876 [Paraburkholderia domus]|uniref:Uncharacterized protein n=1 Tax=Paraburkholderia domus TaxID=2793075 RepID=A0A9N8MWC5_9BURK|nr:hypothetical protein R69749_02876 [Paraburkholderia domus]CAE6816099.1 hypothetical protein R70006_05979 [Paraburkholderia domus]CAE6887504.1 hypothetical protein R70199_02906 [Paraburkholderia domus]CAE6914720.1 hypothetical protein R70211_04133 [Paraburkholderia domus]CAE6932762.1 hypothetical protein R75471_04881 [Paraburkholderia domus]
MPFGGANHRTIAAGPSTCSTCGIAPIIPTSTHRGLTPRTCRSTYASSGRPSSIQSHRLNELLVNMRNVRTSLIVGVLLVELVFGVFLLSHKSHRSTVDPDVTTSSQTELAAISPQLGDTHVAAGSVVGAAPLASNTATSSGQSTSGTVVTASDSPAKGGAPLVRPDTRTREPVAAHGYVEPKTNRVWRTESGRDGLHRHGSNPVASAMTDELVKESAKLDPALPPPTQPALSPTAQPSHNDPYRPGSNPIAAAMTDQLVRESAKLDPALPPPDQAGMK